MKHASKLTAALGAVVLITSYQNCSAFKIEIDPFQKSSFISTQKVFTAAASTTPIGAPGTGDGFSVPNNPSGSDGTGIPTAPGDSTAGTMPGMPGSTPGMPGSTPGMPGGSTIGATPGAPGDSTSGTSPKSPTSNDGNDASSNNSTLQFSFLCSNARTADKGVNLSTASAIKLNLTQSGTVQCSIESAELKNLIINEKKVTLANIGSLCPGLTVGTYTLQAIAEGGSKGPKDIIYDFTSTSVKVIKDTNDLLQLTSVKKQGDKSSKASKFTILYKKNPSGRQEDCDQEASPLIVHWNSDIQKPAAIDLSAPLDGVMFDIFGLRAAPVAHTPWQISWIKPRSASDNFFIVLPNAQGEVKGIEQMFGDNTSGPDGQFAENGYEALRKWDGRKSDGSYDSSARDGYISKSDEVFSQLRFWADHDADGIAQISELYTLDRLGVELIDLSYDASFAEVDKYGNKTLMKSVVKATDGRLHLMYDLWFRP